MQKSVLTLCCLILTNVAVAQLQLMPLSIQFDSTIAYIGYERADESFFRRNNLVIKNFHKYEDDNLSKYADIILDTGGGTSFQHMGNEIGTFYKYGLLLNDKKVMRLNSGLRDLLPYASGRVDSDGIAIAGTNNWTVTSGAPGVYFLDFTGIDARNLILQATPVAELEILFDTGIEIIVSYISDTEIVVKTTFDHGAVARGFTFVAYLP